MTNKPLTPKQEAFCLRYMETGNATEAYRLAYDSEDMKPASISRKAFELLENVKITAYIAELKARLLKRHDITVERVLAEYAKLAFLDIRKAFDEKGHLKPIHQLDDETAAEGERAVLLLPQGRGEVRRTPGAERAVPDLAGGAVPAGECGGVVDTYSRFPGRP